MNLLSRSNVESILTRLESGEISRQQAVRNILDMPQTPDFEGIWELLIIHVCLIETAESFPQLEQFRSHWMSEIEGWQQRLKPFLQKPKPSFRNAVYHDFEQAKEGLLKNDAVKLVLNLEMHLEDMTDLSEISVAELLEDMGLTEKDAGWFLNYKPEQR